MNKAFKAISDKIVELNEEIIGLLKLATDGVEIEKDLKEVERKREVLREALNILNYHNIYY